MKTKKDLCRANFSSSNFVTENFVIPYKLHKQRAFVKYEGLNSDLNN